MTIEKTSLRKSYLILCEGTDTLMFLIYYLNSNSLRNDSRYSNDIQAMDFGGNENLSNYISTLTKMDGFSRIKKLLILRDAEKDPLKAEQSIKKSLKNNSLPVPDKTNHWCGGKPISTAYCLMPTCSSCLQPGTLEDLCWEILKDANANKKKKDIQSFIDQFRDGYNSIISHEHKSRLHTYFSLHDDFVSLKIGEAAKAGAFDWDNPKLTPLRELIDLGFNV